MSRVKLPSLWIRTILSRMRSRNLGSPYGAMPITLYSPSLTWKPRNAVKAEYRSPMECGNLCSLSSLIQLPQSAAREFLPTPDAVVVHSPTPSMVSSAVSSSWKGLEKRALAACATWWSTNMILPGSIPSSLWMWDLIQSFWSNQLTMASVKLFRDIGKVAREDVSILSNFTSGFS
ncbi:MAG: hypothetical protein BWX47_02160 [candidate division Hyd24-12 bacterium ADurb.Bin004]|nr:MAG: hypothetical protein BWX47_02160 [candidate division Hyd24-12 bacterium ADurb.Bin004]